MQGFCISARNEGKIGAVHAAMWKGREVGVEDCEEGGGQQEGEGRGCELNTEKVFLKISLGLKHAPLDK